MPLQSLVTCAEFERLAAKLGPCELIDGEVRRLSFGTIQHGAACCRIASTLAGFIKHRGLGSLAMDTGIHISQDPPRSRGADVVYTSFRRVPADGEPEGFLTVPPELIVEILGVKDTWEDLSEKVADYHRFGVDMVWVADPYTRTVKKFPRGGQPEIVHEGGNLDGGTILPGFSVPVVRFFGD